MHDPKHLKETSSLVDGALTDSVRQNHWTLLGAFRDSLDAHPIMVPRALQETAAYFMQERGYLRGWQWQTLHRSMCSLVGAMSNAPLYSNLPHSVSLNSVAPHYRAALSIFFFFFFFLVGGNVLITDSNRQPESLEEELN